MKKLILLLMLCSSYAIAAEGIQVKPVHFAKGTSSATINGEITGYQVIDYKLGAKSGQKMNVNFETSNASSYFNVLPPGSETALFVGSTSGNEWTGTLPANGDYRVRVYLMRNAARRNEQARYTLKVGITGSGAVAKHKEDAKVPGTSYHATGQVPCSMGAGQPTSSCNFGVTREGNGSGIVKVTKKDGRIRAIFFQDGKAIGCDENQADPGKFSAKKQGDLNIIRIGSERYEIPDAVVSGG